MNVLLDTDVISQATKSPGDARVLAWLARQEEGNVFLSVVTLAEIRDGVNRMPKGKRRERLDRWLTVTLPERFHGCVLDVNPAVAERAGSVMATARQSGRNIKWMDILIAATALTHGMKLATLNRVDFEGLGVTLIDF